MFAILVAIPMFSFFAFQSHLLNLFDNVNRVVFHEKNYDQILSFQSQEGELVNLREPVNVQVRVLVLFGLLNI